MDFEFNQVPAAAAKPIITKSSAAPSLWCALSKSFAALVVKRMVLPRPFAKARQIDPSTESTDLDAFLRLATTGKPILKARLNLDDKRNNHRFSSMFLPDPIANSFSNNL